MSRELAERSADQEGGWTDEPWDRAPRGGDQSGRRCGSHHSRPLRRNRENDEAVEPGRGAAGTAVVGDKLYVAPQDRVRIW